MHVPMNNRMINRPEGHSQPGTPPATPSARWLYQRPPGYEYGASGQPSNNAAPPLPPIPPPPAPPPPDRAALPLQSVSPGCDGPPSPAPDPLQADEQPACPEPALFLPVNETEHSQPDGPVPSVIQADPGAGEGQPPSAFIGQAASPSPDAPVGASDQGATEVTTAVPMPESGCADTAAKLQKLEAAFRTRRGKTKHITDTQRRELKDRLTRFLQDPHAPGAPGHVTWMNQSGAYVAVCGNWQDFNNEFLMIEQFQADPANAPSGLSGQLGKSLHPECGAPVTATEIKVTLEPPMNIQPSVGAIDLFRCPGSSARDPYRAPDRESSYWIERLNNRLGQGIAWIIAVGQDLIAAKNRLLHGEFENMFEQRQVKLDLRTAQMLMRIAANRTIAKTNHHSLLPGTVTALYQLSGVEAPQLSRAIKRGDVWPSMTAAEAKTLVRELKGAEPKPAPAPDVTPAPVIYDLDSVFKRLTDLLDDELALCPDEATRQALVAKLMAHVQALPGAFPTTLRV